MDLTERLRISRISGKKREEREKIEELALGFLYSLGKLKDPKDLKSMKWNEKKGSIKVRTHTPIPEEPGLLRVSSHLRIRKESIFCLALKAEKRSKLFQATGGVHKEYSLKRISSC